MFAFDRCQHQVIADDQKVIATCGAPQTFIGLHGYEEKQQRWMRGSCGFYSASVGGVLRLVTIVEPKPGYFNQEGMRHARQS